MRIVQIANVDMPQSSGAASTLHALAGGYRAAGHHVTQVLPGQEDGRASRVDADEVITVRAPRMPGTGRRMIVNGRRMLCVLDRVRPDRIEVSDRFSPQAVGRWAQRHRVPTVVISHERLDAALAMQLRHPALARFVADFWNLRLVVSYDTIVCATDWARREFERVGVENVVTVPPGVDLTTFHPDHASPELRRELAPDDEPLLVMADRLAPDTRPELAIETVRKLHRNGMPARLVVAGTGPLLDACRRRAMGLPVLFLGHVADRRRLARLLATADVVLAAGSVETFRVSALEALASGTPVVGCRGGALPELRDAAAGAVTYGHPGAFANAVTRLLSVDDGRRRAAARVHAERFGWRTTVDHMLAVHGADVPRAA